MSISNKPHFIILNKNNLQFIPISNNNNKNNKNKNYIDINNYNNNNNNINKISPLSGSEPKYEPNKWNNNPSIKDNNNCFSYAINSRVKRSSKPQPGYFSGFKGVPENQYACKPFLKRLQKDIPSFYTTTFNNKCKKGFHKAFMAIDNKKNDPDYHFYRQDSNGMWSHKPGRTNVQNLDASGKHIYNPLKANRNYSSFNYSKPCFFFCVNPKLARAHSKKKSTKKNSFFNFISPKKN